DHFILCHNASPRYVRLVGQLFEQLYRGFFSYWKKQGMDLQEPKFPLVAIVMRDRQSFDAYATADAGKGTQNVFGYYNQKTNRMVTYDVPNVERAVATLVHEATHQLLYNTGVQKRYADNPKWVSEGLAIFFESPDFSSRTGWKNVGRVNQVNLRRFQHYAINSRRYDSLATLIGDDERFSNSSTVEAAYGEAWALNYFLLRVKSDEYLAYLKTLSEQPLLKTLGKRERIEAFQEAMGMDLASLDRQFINYMRRVR
ncbi:MAG: DUF1570 domain-containing protein, partial [Planctomycetota bacterium]